jgi:hypothetical protein
MEKVTKRNIKKTAMINSLKSSLGVVSTACEKVGIVRKTFYEWIKNDLEFKEEVDNISEDAIDFVESKLFEEIEKNNITAIIFYLKTKGKKRGFVERTEITNIEQKPFEFTIINEDTSTSS